MAVKLHKLPRGAKGLRSFITKKSKGPVTGTDLGLKKKYGSMERGERVAQTEQMERGLEAAKSVTGSMIPGGLGIKAMRPRDQQGVMAKIKRALTGKVPAKPVSVNISQFKKDPKHSLTSTKVEMFDELLPFVLEMGEEMYRFGAWTNFVGKAKKGIKDAGDLLGEVRDAVKLRNAIQSTKRGTHSQITRTLGKYRIKDPIKTFNASEFMMAFGEDVFTMGFADAQRKLLSLVSKKKIPLADYVKFLGRPDVKKVEERSLRGRIKPRLPK